MFFNLQHFGVKGHAKALRWDQDKFKAKIQDEINLYNQKKRVISASQMEVVRRT